MIKYRQITDLKDSAVHGFANVYISAFGGAPYFETYAVEQVIDEVIKPHLPHCVLVAENNRKVIGLGCAHPVMAEVAPSVKKFLLEHDAQQHIPLPASIYMSELAVLDDCRGHGIGRQIIKERFRWGIQAGYTHFVMRTAAEASNSRHIYEQHFGAKELEVGLHDVSDGPIKSQSEQRVYLWGLLHLNPG